MDAPAKSLMQNFVQFNGFSGCPYCLHRGTSVKTSARGHTHAYPFNRENPLKGYGTERTREETLQHAYEAHKSKLEGEYAPVCGVKAYSWFVFIPGFDIMKGIHALFFWSSPKCSQHCGLTRPMQLKIGT